MSDNRADEQVAMMQGEIDNLNTKVAFLEGKLKELQNDRKIPCQPWDVLPKKCCEKCGRDLSVPSGYVCSDRTCPSQMIPWC